MKQENEKEKNPNQRMSITWFRKWFLNNKGVSILLISLLLFLNVFMFTRIAYLLQPVLDFIRTVALPVLMAGILYYLINPLIGWLEEKRVPRLAGILLVFVAISALIAWGITTLIPILRDQTVSFITNWPTYWQNMVDQVDNWLRSDILSSFQDTFTGVDQNLISAITDQTNTVLDSTFAGIGSVVGTITSLAVAIITTPFILFYLLKEGHNLPYHLMKFIPTRIRNSTYSVLTEINKQISQYIRGQLTVAFFVTVTFWIGFSIIGLEYAVTLSVFAGFLNLIPYLGTFLANIPVVILALVDSPGMLVRALIVFVIEQTLEGRVIQPLVLSNSLKMHPITIIFVLLTAGNLFGISGVIFGIPGYAILKILCTHLFVWYKNVSGLYEHDYNPAPEPNAPIEERKKKQKNTPSS